MLNRIIPFTIFAQCFGFPFLSYLFIFLSLLFNKITREIIAIYILLILMMISLVIREADLMYSIRAVQYYGGILLIYAALKLNKNIIIGKNIFIIFAIFVIGEVFLKINGYQIFYLDAILLSKGELDLRTSMDDGYFRALGPALNSSVSSSILAIGILKANEIRKHYIYLVLCLVAFMLCWSATGFLIFLIYIFYKIRNKLQILSLIIIFLFIMYLELPKVNLNYIIYIIEYKYLYFLNSNHDFLSLIFGKNLKDELIGNIGGDSIYLNFININGLIFVGIFTFLVIKLTNKINKIFIIAGILASFHYGVIFNLMGQFIFGALMAGKVQVYRK